MKKITYMKTGEFVCIHYNIKGTHSQRLKNEVCIHYNSSKQQPSHDDERASTYDSVGTKPYEMEAIVISPILHLQFLWMKSTPSQLYPVAGVDLVAHGHKVDHRVLLL